MGSIKMSSTKPELDFDKSNGSPQPITLPKSKQDVNETVQQIPLKDWWTYFKRYPTLLPFFWPSEDPHIRSRVTGVLACLLFSRTVNVLLPLQFGRVINRISNKEIAMPWGDIGAYIFLRFLHSPAGVERIQLYLWHRIEKSIILKFDNSAYAHVMLLSADFHDNKTSSSVIEAIRMGRSVVDLFYSLLINTLPVAIDLVIAIGFFLVMFGDRIASLASISILLYLWASSSQSATRGEQHKIMMTAQNEENRTLTDTLMNWSFVLYFNRFQCKADRYAGATELAQTKHFEFMTANENMNALRSLILLAGLGAACMVASYQIRSSKRPVGDLVILISYWAQLSLPTQRLAGIYMRISLSIFRHGRLFDILLTQPTVSDRQDARNASITRGKVEFDNVSFSYDGKRDILKSISFRAEPGQTIAFVGETGGGKSTILKLIFRMYDASQGSIKIDGQDIRDMKMISLRDHLGIVPQDVVLWNTTIMDNLKYANLNATEKECEEACVAAAVHDKIMSFPQGYQTIVGERGLKLSGGELQRLAIARVILRNSKIVLFDEATSSIDNETERMVKESLGNWTRNRTTFIVAHRLSTIARADQIMVIRNGSIVERGTHETLLRTRGHYYRLWSKQILSCDVKPLSRSMSWNSAGIEQIAIKSISETS